MARLSPPEAVRRAAAYSHVVLSFVDDDGYPASVAGDFEADADADPPVIVTGPFAPDVLPRRGHEVGLIVSHIRPQPGEGYDQRRYVNLWGTARVDRDRRVHVAVTDAVSWDEAETPFFEYAERNTARARGYLDELGTAPWLSRFWKFFLATRLPFLTATIVPIALGGAIAADHGRFAWGWFLLAMVAGVAVHVGLNIANDLFDEASGADAANLTPTPFSGGSRVLQYGLVSRRAMVTGAAVAYGVAAAIGLWLAVARTPWVIAVGAAGVLISLAYTAPPLRLVHRGLGEITTAVGFGPLMVIGTYLVCAERWSWEALYASLPVAILIALVLYVNEIPDRAGDAAVGKRTLPVRWPKERVVLGYAVGATAAFDLIALGAITELMPWQTLIALLGAVMARRVWRDLRDHYDRPYDLMPAMQRNIGVHLFTGLLLVLGYVLA